tara:strand:+ start:4581 stop:4811 length:231 start_codon:yes stop_codon:yes gene_type:complete
MELSELRMAIYKSNFTAEEYNGLIDIIQESLCGIELEKLEWIHSQISELKEDEEVDLETMQSYIEDLREPYLKEEK